LIAVVLLAVYALASRWLLVLYVCTLAGSYLCLRTVHRSTLLYGRVLISVTTAAALVIVVPLVVAFPIERGLSAYFVAILAGINAYNWHTAHPSKRSLFAPLTLGTFTMLLLLARSGDRVLPGGIPQSFDLPVVASGALIALVCFAYAESATVDRPSRAAVFEASVLSGDDPDGPAGTGGVTAGPADRGSAGRASAGGGDGQ
jgi:hypothetical protein